jgi:hypothetical protein
MVGCLVFLKEYLDCQLSFAPESPEGDLLVNHTLKLGLLVFRFRNELPQVF